MSRLAWPPKKPHDILDYVVDWSASLGGEIIRHSAFDVPPGLIKLSERTEDTRTQLWLTGGEGGQHYIISNRIRTSGGRIVERQITLPVVDG